MWRTKNAFAALSVAALVTPLLWGFVAPVHAAQQSVTPRALLYVNGSASGLVSLRAHIKAMDIVAPQTYAATSAGNLLGKPNQELLLLSRNAGAQVMPLIVNKDFSQSGMHALLTDTSAQDKLLNQLVAEAKLRGYVGYQYDFEHMKASDVGLYSAFVEKSAHVLHDSGFSISVAVAPHHSDNPADYGPGSWENWTGAFDYAALGRSADFLSVMAYDDSNSVGPTASVPWVKQVLSYTLARVPANKVSLGVPFYAWVWNDKTNTRDHIVGYPAVANLLNSKQVKTVGFSEALGVPWVTYKKGGKTLTAWYENDASFQKKMALVHDNNLAGFSAWVLGLEDPAVWNTVIAMRSGASDLAFR